MLRLIALVPLLLGAAQEKQDDPLKPLAWLAGTWEGTGKYDEMEFESTLTYEWTLNKNFMKHTYEARAGGQVVWTDSGMLGWDREKKKFVTFTFGIDGSIGNGTFEESKEKDTWIEVGSIQSEDPRFKDFRSVMKKVDEDTWTNEVQSKKDGKFVTFMNCSYKRTKDKK